PLESAATIIEERLFARAAAAREALDRAGRSVRALQLRSRLLSRFDTDWPGAGRALREALKIDAGSPSTHSMLGDVLLAMRRSDEAAPHHRLVAELMPADAHAQIAGVFADYFGPMPRDAAPSFAALAEGDWLVRAHLAGGDVLRARQAAATPFGRALVAAFTRDSVYAAPFTAHEHALLFSVAGAVDAAVQCLEASDEEARFFAAVEPLFLPLHGEPRFLEWLSSLGL
ncbi:MAG TPA: hypothetical protein VG323_03485, partial [Thermoanaerobaculia bacterium]|nr:hypothetical protein [Thermoanaerobaculia bacterium]